MFPKRYNKQNLNRLMNDPSLLVKEVKRSITIPYTKLRRCLNELGLRQEYGDPIDIMEEDWDNLFILDACRFDAFKDVNHIDGELRKVVSTNSQTAGFTEDNFKGEEFHDTVYITANGFGWEQLEENNNIFHKVAKTYGDKEATSPEEIWPQGSPKSVSDTVMEQYEEYKDKRIIVHFVQPHVPYLGDYAEELRKDLRESEGIVTIWDEIRDRGSEKKPTDLEVYRDLSEVAQEGIITDEELWKVYIENLELVLEEVEDLLQLMEGKTVITADHGEMLGSPSTILPMKRKYLHPKGSYVPELRVVPWFTVEKGERRKTVSEPPVSNYDVSQESVEENLKALGYMD